MHKENVFFTTDKYSNLKDEEIISQIKSGDKDALSYLLEKYKNLVNIKVSKYFMIGAKICRLGLSKATFIKNGGCA